MSSINRFRVPAMLAVTTFSVVVAWSVISGSSSLTGDLTELAVASPGAEPGDGDEIVEIVADLVQAPGPMPDEGLTLRDPLMPYSKPKPKTTTQPKPTKPKPAAPRYTVAAVIIDENPRAIMRSSDGTNVVVKVGDTLGGKRVVSIRHDGVTTDDGKTYAYP